jgi:hypothetical protein
VSGAARLACTPKDAQAYGMDAVPTLYWVAEASRQRIYASFGARINLASAEGHQNLGIFIHVRLNSRSGSIFQIFSQGSKHVEFKRNSV